MVFSTFKLLIVLYFFNFSPYLIDAQNIHLDKDKVTLSFKNIGDLVVVTGNLNGIPYQNFIIDTGTSRMIVFDDMYFSKEQMDKAIDLKSRGLGADTLLAGKLLKGNTLKLHQNLKYDSLNIYYLENSSFDLGAKFGVKIHGIIGNDLFNDHFLHLNYSKSTVSVSKNLKKSKKYNSVDLKFIQSKPFIDIYDKKNKYELLIDTGGSDAIWLFDSNVDWHKVPHIRDFLGFGLAGEIIGNRVKKDSLYFQNHLIDKVYLAIPDTIYTNYIQEIYPTRNGSVGAKFLKRFNWVIDYKNKKLFFKPNRFLKKEFVYNPTGLEVYQPLEGFKLYVIHSILSNSPADKLGLRPGDTLIAINNLPTQEMSLNRIYELLAHNMRKKMTITINRNGQYFHTEFSVNDILK